MYSLEKMKLKDLWLENPRDENRDLAWDPDKHALAFHQQLKKKREKSMRTKRKQTKRVLATVIRMTG